MCNGKQLKAILRHMVARAGGTNKAADLCGSPSSELSLWTNDESNRFIPVDHLLQLDARVGDLFLKEFARLRGYELVAGAANAGEGASIIRSIAELSRESGQLEFTTLEAIEDNHLTPAERRRIQDCIAPVKDKIGQLESAIQ